MKVDTGSAYTNHTDCSEFVHYLSKSSLLTKIANPLNENIINYYAIMNDGSSSAKTMDEKELFVIKTADTRIPKCSVLSLEEVEEADAEGLKMSLEKSLSKLNLNFPRENKEIGMCTDGAAVNVKLHRLVREDLGEH